MRPATAETRIHAPTLAAPRFQTKLAATNKMTSESAVLLTVPPSVICSTPDTALYFANVSDVSAGLPDRMLITPAIVLLLMLSDVAVQRVSSKHRRTSFYEKKCSDQLPRIQGPLYIECP